jgi:hypothetical protein
MKKLKRISMLIPAAAIASSLVSCGKTDINEESTAVVTTAVTDVAADVTENETETVTDGSAVVGYVAASTGTNTVKAAVTTAANSYSASPSTTARSSSAVSPSATTAKKSSSSSATTAKKSSSSSAVTTVKKSSSSTAVTTAKNTSNPATSTEPVENVTEPEENPYAAEIVLGSETQINGEGAYVDGSKIEITAGGHYLISGTLDDGQVEINTTEKVKLFLDGVNISNSTGPAIQCTNAKRLTIELVDGTSSYLTDGAKDKVNDGVIFSNDTIEIKGGGELNIVANNAHGIASDDDVIIEDGVYNITSKKSGIFAHDDITIDGGTLDITGGTNGIKSKGTININGGYSIIRGGSKEEKSSIYADGLFTYTGGYVYAIGNTVTAPESSQPYAIAGFSDACPEGSTVSFILDGNETSVYTDSSFMCVMMLSPDISYDSSFAVNVNGTVYGDYAITTIRNMFVIG